jgi:hypothetical protein
MSELHHQAGLARTAHSHSATLTRSGADSQPGSGPADLVSNPLDRDVGVLDPWRNTCWVAVHRISQVTWRWAKSTLSISLSSCPLSSF